MLPVVPGGAWKGGLPTFPADFAWLPGPGRGFGFHKTQSHPPEPHSQAPGSVPGVRSPRAPLPGKSLGWCRTTVSPAGPCSRLGDRGLPSEATRPTGWGTVMALGAASTLRASAYLLSDSGAYFGLAQRKRKCFAGGLARESLQQCLLPELGM